MHRGFSLAQLMAIHIGGQPRTFHSWDTVGRSARTGSDTGVPSIGGTPFTMARRRVKSDTLFTLALRQGARASRTLMGDRDRQSRRCPRQAEGGNGVGRVPPLVAAMPGWAASRPGPLTHAHRTGARGSDRRGCSSSKWAGVFSRCASPQGVDEGTGRRRGPPRPGDLGASVTLGESFTITVLSAWALARCHSAASSAWCIGRPRLQLGQEMLTSIVTPAAESFSNDAYSSGYCRRWLAITQINAF